MDGICVTFILCCQLGELCGQTAIGELPGCWEHQLDDDWHLSFNGNKHAVKNSRGDPVPGYSVWVQHARVIACGVISPVGGLVLGASEADLLTALEAAIRKLGGTPATEQENGTHE